VDNAGNRTSRTPQPSGTASNFTYDAIYELMQVTQGGSTTESYTFDPVGNRLSNLAGSGWSYNSSNELGSRTGFTYTYDNNGNTATEVNSSGTTTFAWDYENRLTSVTLPGSGGTVSFKYDPFGRRVYKSSSTATSIYAYDGDNLIEETNASGGVVARYEDTQNIDEPLAMLRSATTSYYQADGLGSITSLSSSAGALAQTYTFDSFGNQTASSGSLTNPFRYTARESDPETGLYYYRARYYDPGTGRFLGEDPLQFAAHGSNFYEYGVNSPSNFGDPSGLDPSAWQRLLNWFRPSPAPGLPPQSSNCPPKPIPGYLPPWLPNKVFNRFKTGPSGNPYRPNAGPQAPEAPINPTEPPPVIDPPLPGGLPETIPPTPFTPAPSPPEAIPGIGWGVRVIMGIIDALGNLSDPIIIVKQPCKLCS
jgi:RHS repeat-associated protein